MPHDYRPAHHQHDHARPHRRKPQRRTSNRETVQSDELSSTSGIRMVKDAQSFNHDRNPHLSQTSLPTIGAVGTPHPKSPAARAMQQQARPGQEVPGFGVEEAPFESTGVRTHGAGNPLYTGETYPVRGTHTNGSLPPVHAHDQQTNASFTGSHRATQAFSSEYPVTHASQSSRFHTVPPTSDQVDSQAEQAACSRAADTANPRQRSYAGHSASFAAVEHAQASPQPYDYQDYTAASGRYKASNAQAASPANFKPLTSTSKHARKRTKAWPRVIAAVAIVVALGIGGFFGYQQIAFAGPITATVNGEKMTLEGSERSIEGLLDNNIVQVTPGNFVAVDESVLREGDGTRCTAIINEQPVSDLNAHINEGDQVVVSNGTDVMEDYTDSTPTVTPAGYSKAGQYGALHVFLAGQDGETVTRTGSESGKTVEQVTKEKIDNRLVYYNANSNGEKVIALTFDDGPWDGSTEQILDILKENGAKATFYTIGEQISSHSDQIARMANEGHEIATHTWDHAAGSGKGVSLNLMSTAERKEEVQKGMDAIKNAANKDASVYFRAPGGNFNDSVANDLRDMVQGEIGWNIDTEDWRRPGADTIASRIKSAGPGEVILMHDGGGDRSQTVAALREALPYLKSQGYKFVTISELIEAYPYQEGQHS